MLFSTAANGQRSPLQLTGFAGGNGSIEQLQQAITGLSRVVRRPALNPGIVTGTINDATMRALMSSMDLLGHYMSTESFNAVQEAFGLGLTSSQARTTIAQNATQLTMAAKTCIAQYATHMGMQGTHVRGMGAPPVNLLGLGDVPWYQSTGVVVAVIGGLLIGAYALLGGSK